MARKTLKMLLVALIAAFSLSSMAEAAAPKRTVKHRAKHSSRVASGAAVTTTRRPAAKKKAPAAAAKSRTHAQPHATARKPAARKAPARRRPATKPR